MHGAAHTAKAPPRSTREPRPRASCSRPAPTSRSGQGRSPMNASPKTTSTKPATRSSRNWSPKTRPPTSAAPTPRSTKNVVNPTTNGTLPVRTRRAVPGWPSRSASTAETADRYAGTSGSTQGARNETMPATNATGIDVQLTGSAVEACELLVDETLELRVEVLVGGGRRPAAPAPRADEEPDDHRSRDDRGERQEPGEKSEAAAQEASRAPRSRTVRPSASLISCSESPAAIRTRMNAFICSATGAFD